MGMSAMCKLWSGSEDELCDINKTYKTKLLLMAFSSFSTVCITDVSRGLLISHIIYQDCAPFPTFHDLSRSF